MGLVTTEFDGLLEEDLILEETDGVMETKEILKSAENIFKANLYLKELFTAVPVFNELLSFFTLEASEPTLLTINSETSLVTVKNLRDSELKLYLNDGELVLLAFESFEFPYSEGMILKVKGRASIIESKYV